MNKAFVFGVLVLAPCLFATGCSQSPPAAPPATGTPMGEVPPPPPPPPPPPGLETPGAETGTPGAETPGAATPAPVSLNVPTKAIKGEGLPALPGVSAPKLTKKVDVKFTTDKGDILMEIYPEAAPNGAQRFLELVKAGFYDNTPVFRVVPNFVCQFGINSKQQKNFENFEDDASFFKMEPGTLAFAKAGVPNSASTQVFICYDDVTGPLVPQPGGKGVGIFTAFGKVTKGLDIAKGFKAVGDPSMGLDQGALERDTEGYLKTLPDKPNMIKKAEIVK